MSKTITINCEDEGVAKVVSRFFMEQKDSITQMIDQTLKQQQELADPSVVVSDDEITITRKSAAKGSVLLMDTDTSSLISKPFEELSTGDRYVTLVRGNFVAYERAEDDVDYMLGMFSSVDASVIYTGEKAQELDEQVVELKKRRLAERAAKEDASQAAMEVSEGGSK